MTAMSTLDRPASAAEVKATLYDPVLAHETPNGRMYSRTVGGAPVVQPITNILAREEAVIEELGAEDLVLQVGVMSAKWVTVGAK
jgi:hypothetical protein